MEIAKKLVDQAKLSRADAIKYSIIQERKNVYLHNTKINWGAEKRKNQII